MSALHNSHGIALGYPFDHLFDRECELELGTKIGPSIKGIKLANKDDGIDPGTGNIVIMGPPGSGKSTLALQWAIKCALREDNQSNAAYFSLETSMDELISKAKPFLWHVWLRETENLESTDEFLNADDLANRLKNLLINETANEINRRKQLIKTELGKFDGGDKTRRVLLCSLSPRSMQSATDHEELFWRRYKQVERLLAAAHHLSTEDHHLEEKWQKFVKLKTAGPRNVVLPVMVIDSLNMFGSRPLTRDEIFCIFSLFRKYQRVGIFVVESTQDSPFDSTMSDVVVSLTHDRDRGYLVQHFEVQKSRYYNQINGLHPYKTVSLFSEKQRGQKPNPKPLPRMPQKGSEPNVARQGIVVYPSLHYIVLRSEGKENNKRAMTLITEPEYFGINAMKAILPEGLVHGSVLALEGPRSTSKTSFALNFLGNGLNQGNSALLIRFSDIPWLKEDPKNKQMVAPRMSKELKTAGFEWEKWHLWPDEPEPGSGGYWSALAAAQKMTVSAWRRATVARDGVVTGAVEPTLFEMNFKSGMLMPEEFVEIIRNLFIRRFKSERHRIKRVVLDDISQIGVSYPFLKHSITTGDIFLSAFVHIMRNYQVDLVMTGTTGGGGPADEFVNRACSLADTVVSFKYCDVFGARHVVVSGEGLRVGRSESNRVHGELVPAVVRLLPDNTFAVDGEHLQGLVGFETNHIHRPGVIIHLFQGNNTVHDEYNRGIRTMLEAGFASTSKPKTTGGQEAAGQVEMVAFTAKESEAIHAAFNSFHCDGRPLDRTVLYSVDEFSAPHEIDDKEMSQWIKVPSENISGGLKWEDFLISREHSDWPDLVWPYFSNVLFVAYRKDGLKRHGHLDMRSWNQVEELAELITPAAKNISANKSDPKGAADLPAIERGFWVDLSASETLSCILLDALQAAHERKYPDFMFLVDKKERRRITGSNDQLTSAEYSEVRALTKLLQRTGECTDEDKERLPANAGIYVCWYSQLRELIQRKPALATKLDVCPLPGGGFSGDWFLGVVRGSVSPALGRRIVKTLCGMEEDHKRYLKGVGLPTRKLFYSREFYAWPRGKHMPLKFVRHIWENALKRGNIGRKGMRDYLRIRADISALAWQLTVQAGDVTKSNTPEEILERVGVERLLIQIPKLIKTPQNPSTR